MLVVKHVFLTPVCELIGHHLPQARFLAIMRDPPDIFASVLRAKMREQQLHHVDLLLPGMEKLIAQWVVRFNQYYGAVLRAAANEFHGRLLAVDHQTLCRGNLDSLSEFLNLSDIDPRKLWERSVFDINTYKDDPVFSGGWGKPLDTSSTRSYRNELSEQFAQIVSRDTSMVRSRFLALSRDAKPQWAAARG